MRLFLCLLVIIALLPSIDCKKIKAKKEKVLVVEEEEQEVFSVPSHSHILRPRHLQMYSKYERCKMECAKLKEQEDLALYMAQLKEEIAAAEAILAEEEAAAEAEAAVHEELEETEPVLPLA